MLRMLQSLSLVSAARWRMHGKVVGCSHCQARTWRNWWSPERCMTNMESTPAWMHSTSDTFQSICSLLVAYLNFDFGLGQILHDQLYWLDVPDRVLFKLALHSIQSLTHFNHRHRIDKYLDTFLASQTARKALPPIIAKSRNRKMADCPSYY